MNRLEETLYLMALTRIPGVGDVVAKKLVAYCGGAKQVFSQSRAALKLIPSIGNVLANAVHGSKVLNEAEKEMAFAEKHGIQTVSFLDTAYPQRLKHCEDSPIVLFVKGKANLNPEKVVAVVGTRNATRYGKDITEKIVQELAAANVTVISGLAYGIDVTAHKAAIKFDTPTIACLAHGLDRMYPKIHAAVAKEIAKQGALITDFPSGTNPDRENFPKRNRIVAGMTDATIVVEAGIKGGALITAEIANGYNRDVFAIPGKIGDKYSEGCHKVISQNKAALITSGKDVLKAMRWDDTSETKKAALQPKLLLNLSPDQEKVVDILREKELTVDALALQTGFTMSQTASVLLGLEFDDIVTCLPGKVYKLT